MIVRLQQLELDVVARTAKTNDEVFQLCRMNPLRTTVTAAERRNPRWLQESTSCVHLFCTGKVRTFPQSFY